jgi:hypothetical protein
LLYYIILHRSIVVVLWLLLLIFSIVPISKLLRLVILTIPTGKFLCLVITRCSLCLTDCVLIFFFCWSWSIC